MNKNKRQGLAKSDITSYESPMNDMLLFLGVMVAWFLIVRFVFPRLGIRG